MTNDRSRRSSKVSSHRGFAGRAARVAGVCALAALSGALLVLAREVTVAEDAIGQPPASGRRRDNVIIFLVDTLRADRLGTYGYPKATSPRIDALSAEGVVFEQSYAPSPWTLPSVVSLMTSTFAPEHGVVVETKKIAASLTPLAQRLREAGYATGAFYNNIYVGPLAGLDRGYDLFKKWGNFRDDALDAWLDAVGTRPFFLYVHNMEPHNPYAVPDSMLQTFGTVPPEIKREYRKHMLQYRDLTVVDWSAKRPVGATDNSAEQDRAMRGLHRLKPSIDLLYDAAVRYADESVGKVIDGLKRRGAWDRTLFIFVADHGEELGDHGGWLHDQSVYEELIRVPLIIHFPSGEFTGRRVRDVASLVDVMPTILDYLGRPELCGGCRGTSWMQRLRGDPAPASTAPAVTSVRINRKKYYRPYREGRGEVNVVVRQGQWKGIWNVDTHSFELYDLAADPREQLDQAARAPAIAAGMREYAQTWLARFSTGAADTPPAGLDTLDPATLEGLRSLGYLR